LKKKELTTQLSRALRAGLQWQNIHINVARAKAPNESPTTRPVYPKRNKKQTDDYVS